MRTKEEIQERLLKTYENREKFSSLASKEKHPSPRLKDAYDMVKAVYTEKISELRWVLNEEAQSERTKGANGNEP